MKKIIMSASNISDLKEKMDSFKKEHEVLSAYYTFNTIEYYKSQTPYVQVEIEYKN